MRPILQPVAERTFIHTPFAKALDGVDLGEVIARGRELLAGSPMTIAALGRRLAEDWPDREPGPLGYVIRFHVPLVQIPPRGLWGRRGGPVLALTDEWVGRPMATDGVGRRPGPPLPGRLRPRHPGRRPDLVVADCHPPHPGATAAAAANLSRRGRTRAVRRSGRSAAGPGDAAPVRFLPEYDNIFLSHQDRSRIADPRHKGFPLLKGFVLVDGFIRGVWKVSRDDTAATLVVRPVEPILRADRCRGRRGGRAPAALPPRGCVHASGDDRIGATRRACNLFGGPCLYMGNRRERDDVCHPHPSRRSRAREPGDPGRRRARRRRRHRLQTSQPSPSTSASAARETPFPAALSSQEPYQPSSIRPHSPRLVDNPYFPLPAGCPMGDGGLGRVRRRGDDHPGQRQDQDDHGRGLRRRPRRAEERTVCWRS